MLIYLLLLLLSVGAYADVECCEEKERVISYLDIALDLISKTKLVIPTCNNSGVEKEKCPEEKNTDCADWYNRGYGKSGVYTIWPVNRLTLNKSVNVFCDMDTDGGGWTVLQRRGKFGKPNDFFYKDWNSYRDGFGDIKEDFWLGNDKIFALTNQKPYSIRFDLQDGNLTKVHANYSKFWIDDEFHKYTLHIADYSGTAGGIMMTHNEYKFTTKDKDNLGLKENCAEVFKGAWWYNKCPATQWTANLNGLYNAKNNGIWWHTFHTSEEPSLVWTEIKIRPNNFTPVKKFSSSENKLNVA